LKGAEKLGFFEGVDGGFMKVNDTPVAMMHPEPAKTKRKRSRSLEPKELGISGARIYSAEPAAAPSMIPRAECINFVFA
jgi:hypothetical protein